MKHRLTFWITAAVIAVLVAVFLFTRHPAPLEEPQTAKADVVPAGLIEANPEQQKQIRIDAAQQQTMDVNLEAVGKVGFNEDRVTPVLAPYAGRVLEVLANLGDVVKTGQPLLAVESPELVGAVNDLIEARANVNKGKIANDIAEKSAERARRLHASEALSTKELQAAESELARAQEEQRRGQAGVEIARNRLVLLGKSAEEIARLENSPADERDRRTLIRAPIAGTIVDRKVGLGQYIKPDSPDPLYLISDLSNVWITADVFENDLPRIRVGAPADIFVASYPDRAFRARIAAINPTVDPSTRTVKVRCIVPNSDGLLKPEMFARIRIGDAAKKTVVTVPSSAIITEGERSFVLVEDSPGRFYRREVKTGPETGGNTVVEQGLGANDRVVSSGALLLSGAEAGKQ